MINLDKNKKFITKRKVNNLKALNHVKDHLLVYLIFNRRMISKKKNNISRKFFLFLFL